MVGMAIVHRMGRPLAQYLRSRGSGGLSLDNIAGYGRSQRLMRNCTSPLPVPKGPGLVTEGLSLPILQLQPSRTHSALTLVLCHGASLRISSALSAAIEADALHRTLQLQPHLPACWNFGRDSATFGPETTLRDQNSNAIAIACFCHDPLRSQPTVLCASINTQTNDACHVTERATNTNLLSVSASG